MYELSESELYQALHYAKQIDQDTGRKILEQFQQDQPQLAQTFFGIFASVIAEQDQDMSYLFMDLCFDVLCVFQKAFGDLPTQNRLHEDTLEQQTQLLNHELQMIIVECDADKKLRTKLQDRLAKRAPEDKPQMALINFLGEAIEDYATGEPKRIEAVQITQTMLFIVIRLLNNLYDCAKPTLH